MLTTGEGSNTHGLTVSVKKYEIDSLAPTSAQVLVLKSVLKIKELPEA